MKGSKGKTGDKGVVGPDGTKGSEGMAGPSGDRGNTNFAVIDPHRRCIITTLGKVMFSQVSVCSPGVGMPSPMSLQERCGYSWCQPPARDGYIQGVRMSRRVCLGCVCQGCRVTQGLVCLGLGMSCCGYVREWVRAGGGYPSPGPGTWDNHAPTDIWWQPPHIQSAKRAIRIRLECFLVLNNKDVCFLNHINKNKHCSTFTCATRIKYYS